MKPLKASVRLETVEREGKKTLFRVSAPTAELGKFEDAKYLRLRVPQPFVKGGELLEDEFVSAVSKKGANFKATIPFEMAISKGLDKLPANSKLTIEVLGIAKEKPRVHKLLKKAASTEKLESATPKAEASILEDVRKRLAELTELVRGQPTQPSKPSGMDELTQLREQVSKSVTEAEAIKTRLAGLETTASSLNKAVDELKAQFQESAALREKLDGLEKKIAGLAEPPEAPKPTEAEAKPPTRSVGVVPPPLFLERRVSLAPVEVKVVREEPPPYTPPPPPGWRVEETLMDGVVKIWDEKDAFVAAVATKPRWFCSHCKSSFCKHVAFTQEWLKKQKR